MPSTRRALLLGSGAVLATAAGGAGAFVATRDPAMARAPWDRAGAPAYAEPRLRALSYAVLAPNPHNRQPWIAELAGADEIVLRCDPARRLPETDPFDRQIVIGLGCFLELLRMAAAEGGFRAEIDPFPEGEPAPRLDARPIARIRFTRDAAIERDPLFAQVGARRSNRSPFDTARPVAASVLADLKTAALATGAVSAGNDPALLAAGRDLTWRAFLREVAVPRAFKESVDLMRIGKGEIEADPDGISIAGAFPEALNLLGVFTRETIVDPASTAHREMLARFRPVMASAMAYVWIATPDNGRRDQLAVGRDWLRLNLKATQLGVAFHPLSQALQEFAEMKALFDEAHRLFPGGAGWRLQMLGRLGYGQTVPAAARWPVETRIKRV